MSTNSNETKPAVGALDGIRVIELARVPPAEVPGMMMSDMGAEVIKVDSPTGTNPHGSATTRDAAFSPTNRNKKSIILNLKDPDAKEVLRRLVATADVLIEGYRPGVMDRLGVGFAELRKINPRLVYCALSSFGQDGPYRLRPAHDMNFMAMSGAFALFGEPGKPPVVPLNLIADLGGASMHAFGGILAALLSRQRTGRGQIVDISYLDCTMALLGASLGMRHYFSRGEFTPQGAGICSLTYPYYSCYLTRDGRYLTVACSETPLWVNFCNAIGRPDLSRVTRPPDIYGRAANEDEQAVTREVAAVIAQRDASEWERTFEGKDVCCAVIRTVDEAVSDSQLRHRGMIVDVNHAEFGAIRHIGPAIRLSETPARVRGPGPQPGEHSASILEELGYSPDEVQRMVSFPQ